MLEHKSLSFPFHRLSTELAVEVIRHASTPDFGATSSNVYSNPLTICLVSHEVRKAAMPQLLHTVLLSQGCNVYAFIRTILMQRTYRQNQSRLALNYSIYVKRMWCGMCREALVDEPRDSPMWLDYGALWEVMRNVESLGIDNSSLHLLYNGLATDVDAMNADGVDEKGIMATRRWKCRKVTFAGDYWRWKPLTSTAEGSAFLASITHLVLWMREQSHCHHHGPQPASTINSRFMEDVPFEMMKNLTDVGFVLLRNPTKPIPFGSFVAPTEMLAYHLPTCGTTSTDSTSDHDATVFRSWAMDYTDPVSHGLVLPLYVDPFTNGQRVSRVLHWEKAWAMGQSEYSWEAAQRRAQLARKETCVVEPSVW